MIATKKKLNDFSPPRFLHSIYEFLSITCYHSSLSSEIMLQIVKPNTHTKPKHACSLVNNVVNIRIISGYYQFSKERPIQFQFLSFFSTRQKFTVKLVSRCNIFTITV